jgi:2-dehydro-3-deoxyphosphooctonate aldolase (KDO 8-P synthase)
MLRICAAAMVMAFMPLRSVMRIRPFPSLDRSHHQLLNRQRAPRDVQHVIEKVTAAGNSQVIVTERGTSFGYNNLVVDMRGLPMLRELGYPVIFDVTHSLQLPGGGQGRTAGLAEYIEPLASAGVAAGVDGVFLEVHPEPSSAMSDAENALRLDGLERLLQRLARIDAVVKEFEQP